MIHINYYVNELCVYAVVIAGAAVAAICVLGKKQRK